jgi:hypothetical protein
MIRSIFCAAIAAAAISLAAPAQAMPADAGLNASAPATVQLAYWRHGHYYGPRRGWYRSYAYSPYRHRHCWTVRTWHGWVRRCSW